MFLQQQQKKCSLDKLYSFTFIVIFLKQLFVTRNKFKSVWVSKVSTNFFFVCYSLFEIIATALFERVYLKLLFIF